MASSHWYSIATFKLPDRFDVIIEGDTAKIASLDPLPFSYHKSNDDFIVRTSNWSFVVQGGTFTFNGVDGEATGTIAGQ